MSGGTPKLCLFGSAGDTGNLGVSALLHSALGGVQRSRPGASVTVFDNGWGMRAQRASFATGELAYRACGARLSKRIHRPESYWNMGLSARLGGLVNPGARALLGADLVWDVSAGDSFADLYGERTFRAIVAPKHMALRFGIPLVLLPQTYGPFASAENRRVAEAIVRTCSLAWARDERSFQALQELAGDAFDPERHRSGVDMAFALEPREPRERLPERIASWLSDTDRGSAPVVGVNVSGLCYNDPRAGERFGFRADYRVVMRRFLQAVLKGSAARILLVPHVLAPSGRIESDQYACQALVAKLPKRERERIEIVPVGYDQSETKWILSRLDWFTGTRMHACIGALSSGVPAAGVAYSLKTQGVFESCAMGEHVADLRALDEEEMVESLMRSFEARQETRLRLAEHLPAVYELATQAIELSFDPAGGRARAVE